MSSTSILSTCFDIMHFTGATRLAKPALAGKGVIFCLHRVIPDGGRQSGFSPNAKLEISPEFLSEIISLMRGSGYDLLSMTEATERLSQPGKRTRRFAVFTLDDGYTDNLVHAMPVFERLSCPFTVFVAPRIAEGTCELWWLLLEALIGKGEELAVTLDGGMQRFRTDSDAAKASAWNTLFPVLSNMPQYEQRKWIIREAEAHGIDANALCRSLAMTWDQIRHMNKSPLATIGAHTLNHYNLLRLPPEDAYREISDSGRIVAEQIGESVQHFAYPYGNVDAAGPREFEMCKRAGYMSSVVTRLGPIYAEHSKHLQALPRIMVSGRFQKRRYIDALVSGLPGLLKNKGRRMLVS